MAGTGMRPEIGDKLLQVQIEAGDPVHGVGDDGDRMMPMKNQQHKKDQDDGQRAW